MLPALKGQGREGLSSRSRLCYKQSCHWSSKLACPIAQGYLWWEEIFIVWHSWQTPTGESKCRPLDSGARVCSLQQKTISTQNEAPACCQVLQRQNNWPCVASDNAARSSVSAPPSVKSSGHPSSDGSGISGVCTPTVSSSTPLSMHIYGYMGGCWISYRGSSQMGHSSVLLWGDSGQLLLFTRESVILKDTGEQNPPRPRALNVCT